MDMNLLVRIYNIDDLEKVIRKSGGKYKLKSSSKTKNRKQKQRKTRNKKT